MISQPVRKSLKDIFLALMNFYGRETKYVDGVRKTFIKYKCPKPVWQNPKFFAKKMGFETPISIYGPVIPKDSLLQNKMQCCRRCTLSHVMTSSNVEDLFGDIFELIRFQSRTKPSFVGNGTTSSRSLCI